MAADQGPKRAAPARTTKPATPAKPAATARTGRPARTAAETRRRKNAKLAAELAAELRGLILSGELAHGAELPSQAELVAKHGLSTETVRAAVDELASEGLVDKGQGRPSVVTSRPPAHRIRLGSVFAGSGRLAEPPISFRRAGADGDRDGDPDGNANGGRHDRAYDERAVTLPEELAEPLGLTAGTPMLARTVHLRLDGESVLTSTSYLPAELATAGGTDWHTTEVGELALVGHVVTPGLGRERSRPPGRVQRDELGVSKGVSMKTLTSRYRVHLDDRTVPAGVVVVARGDRVILEWGQDP